MKVAYLLSLIALSYLIATIISSSIITIPNIIIGTIAIGTLTYLEIHRISFNKQCHMALEYSHSGISRWSGKTFLAICNPVSGSGQGRIYFDKIVMPMLKKCNIKTDCLWTAHQGHTSEIAQKVELQNYCGILVIGGDGTLHELLNGLYEREEDEEEFRILMKKLVIGIIPVGSANGFAASMGALDIFKATTLIIEGHVQPVDLFQVSDEKDKKLWEATLISWGNVADFDYLTEGRFRWMGPLKEAFVAPMTLWWTKSYQGKLSYLLEDKWKTISGKYHAIIGINVPYITRDIILSPELKIGGGFMDVVAFSACPLLTWLRVAEAFTKSQHLTKKEVILYRTSQWKLEITNGRISVGGQNWDAKKIEVKVYPQMIFCICTK